MFFGNKRKIEIYSFLNRIIDKVQYERSNPEWRIHIDDKFIHFFEWNKCIQSLEIKYFEKKGFQLRNEVINKIDCYDRFQIKTDKYYIALYQFRDVNIFNCTIKYTSLDKFTDSYFTCPYRDFKPNQMNMDTIDSIRTGDGGLFPILLYPSRTGQIMMDESQIKHMFEDMRINKLLYVDIGNTNITFKMKNKENIVLPSQYFIYGETVSILLGRRTPRMQSSVMWISQPNDGVYVGIMGNQRDLYSKNKTKLDEEQQKFSTIMKQVNKMKKFSESEIDTLRGKNKCFRLLLQLLEDYNINFDMINDEIKYYRYLDSDSNEIALFRAWEAIGTTVNSKEVMAFFTTLLISSKGFSFDWKYDDQDLFYLLNKTPVFIESKVEIRMSEHKGLEPFDISYFKDGGMIQSISYQYPSKDYHDAVDIINRINTLIESTNVKIYHSDDGSDSFSFIPLFKSDYQRFEQLYGKFLPRILSPLMKVRK